MPDDRLSRNFELLVANVNPWIRVAYKDTLPLPISKVSAGSAVLLVSRITWLVSVRNQPNDIRGMLFVELGQELIVDRFSGGSYNTFERANVPQVISDATKSRDLRHDEFAQQLFDALNRCRVAVGKCDR